MARPYPSKKPARRTRAVVVNGYSAGWLRQGFPWVYPKEVVHRPKGCAPGRIVALEDEQGQDLGAGVWDEGWISVRRFREDAGKVDRELLRGLLEQARALRDQVVDSGTTAYRLVAGENDGMPGIRVDVYGHFLVVSLDSPSLQALLEPLCDLLEEQLSPRGIFLAWRPDPRETSTDRGREAGLIRGRAPTSDVRVTERGLACMVRPGAGKDIGLYTDMRDNRAWLEPFWGGKRVLNLFAHTGFFSVAAAARGATEVVSVDLSEAYLDRAEAHIVANEQDPGAHTFLAQDVRKALDRFRRQSDLFDVVLLDPPGFSHSGEGLWSAKKDYPRMVTSCLRVLEPGGWLVAALNVGEVSPRDFHGYLRQGGQKAGRRLQLIYEGGQACDHPGAMHFPEARYLKFAVYRAL